VGRAVLLFADGPGLVGLGFVRGWLCCVPAVLLVVAVFRVPRRVVA
jgi:hypothetical protein